MSDDLQPRRQRPLPRTPVALSVLSLLNERSMHPYEMRSLMRERRHDRAFRIRESSVYDTVTRLAERGFIEPVEVNREGRRPERTVYAITESGRDELLVWLWDLASEPAAEYPAFAAPLMFIYSLGLDRAIAALQQRAAKLEAEISSNDAGVFRMSSATAPAVLVTGLRKSFRVAGGTVGLGFLVMAAAAALAICWGTRAYQRAMA